MTPSTADLIEGVSPVTEQIVGRVPRAARADIDAAVAAARAAFDDPQGWSRWEPARRQAALEAAASALDERGEEMARRVTLQNRMPAGVATAIEGSFPELLIRYCGEMVSGQAPAEIRQGLSGSTVEVRREPIGVVGAIVPWNVPQGITALKLAPALVAGCTMVLKPAEETVLDAFLLGAYLVEHSGVDKVSFTSSTASGRAIGKACGKLLRPVTLELGGKSAAIVLDDVDLSAHMESFFAATMLNNGQIYWLRRAGCCPANATTSSWTS